MRAFHATYGLNTVVTRGSNTFGPFQYPEKLIPLFVTNLIDGEKVARVRRWPAHDGARLAVMCSTIVPVSISACITRTPGRGVPISPAATSDTNLGEVTHAILGELGKGEDSIKHVPDRPGHDRRYSVGLIGKTDGAGIQTARLFRRAAQGNGGLVQRKSGMVAQDQREADRVPRVHEELVREPVAHRPTFPAPRRPPSSRKRKDLLVVKRADG